MFSLFHFVKGNIPLLYKWFSILINFSFLCEIGLYVRYLSPRSVNFDTNSSLWVLFNFSVASPSIAQNLSLSMSWQLKKKMTLLTNCNLMDNLWRVYTSMITEAIIGNSIKKSSAWALITSRWIDLLTTALPKCCIMNLQVG